MALSDLVTIANKDLLLLWRDRSLPFIILLWLAPFGGLVRSAMTPSDPDSTPARINYLQSRPNHKRQERSQRTTKDHEVKVALEHVYIGVIGGAPPKLEDSRFAFRSMPESQGIPALERGDIDILVRFPDNKRESKRATAKVMIIKDLSITRSATASSMFYNYLEQQQVEQTKQRIAEIAPEQRWVYSKIDTEFLEDDTKPWSQQKLFGIGGALILGAALISTLVMLIIVEENNQHTLPMMLVCAVDRRVIFTSKLLFCALPAISAVLTATFRTWRALPPEPISALTLSAILGTASLSGLIFVWIASVALVTTAGRARNNIEAAAKVGAPMILIGLMVIVAMTPLVSLTPGLSLVPVTNLVMCLNQLISASPNWSMCAVALSTSILFALLLTVSGMRTFRCEEGLPGDVAAADPRLNALFSFFLSGAVLVLLYNFVGLPARIVYPAVGEIVTAAMFLVVLAAVLKSSRMSPRAVLFSKTSGNAQIVLLLLGIAGGALTAWLFSSGASWNFGFAATPEALKVNQVITGQSISTLALVLALVRVVAEELALRGALVKLLVGNVPNYSIILLLASLGAALHPLGTQWFFMALFSALLTFVRLKSGSAIPCIAMRVSHHVVLWSIWSKVTY